MFKNTKLIIKDLKERKLRELDIAGKYNLTHQAISGIFKRYIGGRYKRINSVKPEYSYVFYCKCGNIKCRYSKQCCECYAKEK